ncbi:bifunctional phosphopantothenoylcysteine decarboxylase/phosphopantothenate--cysteine ligase CoaBC [Paeniglutamicibacter sulfureus]|uniref:bifunctional phosphopantothenoylcysteine decarboxylase/phosphopantothenate--cysteine ligase CoaBC n=1 Tax=Paeniglutamicibacter sulfureus TaxID=43666 RepID=UPI0026671282|nr:bifunctional phosphopantothenoylcysteine decarboxylase/phosphopantothenate--cysteine ligase CoaBC [Paeniglutamicibacter sulfureus]MDO2936321.1 bifunctional phosphopantothenoylcysteine decarboxylase/phosphopantothenate--cysteine ligase CoaBC [Paeniglutamicibacter sulfureus]
MKRIVLGVSAGIAAYKAALLLRLFKEAGHQVDVIPTAASLEFVGLATWEALSGRPVRTSVFEAVDTVNHVRLGQEADLVVIAPATADVMARAAAGMANDLLTGTLLATGAPVVMAPAMHTEMWEHPATVANVALLRSRGVHVIEPAVGRLTGKDSGAGRFPEPEDIFAALGPYLEGTPGASLPDAAGAVDLAAGAASPLAGKIVAISAGGTREPLDPVRYLGNRSSGRQGIALAKAALAAGATVRFIAAHMDVPAPAGVELSTASTARQLQVAVTEAARGADALIMSAAVADFRPAQYVDSKIKKSDDHADPVITLVRNPDILATLVADRTAAGSAGDLPQLIVGFAAETGDAEAGVLEYGAAKLKRKGCEMLVVNEVGENLAFGTDENSVTILFADGAAAVHASGSKDEVAASVIEAVGRALAPARRH